MKAGLVAVVGRPNVGKSTLVNALVGQKVAIVSDKPQTTRRGVRGVVTTDDYQVAFTDTPGFHKPRTPLGHRLNEVVASSVEGVDQIVLVVDAAASVGRGDKFVYESQVAGFRGPKLCAVNKIDRLRHHQVVPQLAAAQELGEFDEIVPVSARTGDGVKLLLDLIVTRLPEGPAMFPEGEVTDLPLEVRIAEIVREKALEVTREEVPHSVEVIVDEIVGRGLPPATHTSDHEDDLVRIEATVVVERESQKGIVIGKGGGVLKTIGSRARAELEVMLGSKVYLGLRVKVLKEWQKDPAALNRLGF
jgi:GTP-binding protein Era